MENFKLEKNMNFIKRIWKRMQDQMISETDARILEVKRKYGIYFSYMDEVSFETFLKLKQMEQDEINELEKNRPKY